MEKEIVFVNQSTGYLMVDIVNEFGKICRNRVLIAGSISQRNSVLEDSVKVIKIVEYSRKNNFSRLITWVVGFFQILFIIKFKYRNAHIFFVSNPPLVQFIPLFIKNDYSFLIYDIYPDTLFKYKILKANSFAGQIWKKINQKVFKLAFKIFTISEGMKEIIYQYSKRGDIRVVPIWSDNDYFKSIPDELNPFLIEQGLVGKFIVLYSGNLGLTHDVESIIEIAKCIKQKEIFFLIIGNGEKERILKDAIIKNNLDNCRLLPLQPVESIPFTIGGAKLGIVASSPDSSSLSVPSKAFTLIAAGKPLLCITDPKSELSKIVQRHDIGMSFSSKQIDDMANFICRLYEDESLRIKFDNNLNIAKSFFGKENSQKFSEAFYQ